MWWLIGLVIAGLYGIAQKILSDLQQEVGQERKRWEDSYQQVEREVRQQQARIEETLRIGRDRLQYRQVADLHSASIRIADTTHSLLQDSRKTLDAMGRAIVETAKQRRAIEYQKRNSFFGKSEMERQILGLHKLRDEILIPDKNLVKAQRDRLLAEVRSLNKQTAELRDLKAAIIERNKTLRLEEERKWREAKCKSCGMTIRYKTDWRNIPNTCKSCTAQARAKWKEKSCVTCGTMIRYHLEWNNIPDMCKSCLEAKRNQWKAKPCKDCGTSVKFHIEWSNPPDYCKPCQSKRNAQWKSKACSSCGKPFRYHADWNRIPTQCKSCKPASVQKKVSKR